MLGASFGLILEGSAYGTAQTLAGGALGVVFILIAQKILSGREVELGVPPEAGERNTFSGAGAKQMLLILTVMTVH